MGPVGDFFENVLLSAFKPSVMSHRAKMVQRYGMVPTSS